MEQIQNFNFFQLLFIVVFVTSMQKANTTKLLDKQTSDFHIEIEEVKDTIREVLFK